MIKKKHLIIIGIAIMAIVVIVCISNARHAELVKYRHTFKTVEEMQDAMTGTWSAETTVPDKDGNWRSFVYEQLIINDSGITRKGYRAMYYNEEGPIVKDTYSHINWYPRDGYFTYNFYEAVVSSDNLTLKVSFTGTNGQKYTTEYKRGGSFPTSDPSEYSIYNGLDMVVTSLYNNSGYTVCEAKITNNSGYKKFDFIKVKGVFTDASGKTVYDTDWSYAVGSEGLLPGETKTFRLSVPKNTNIKKCNLTIISD